MPVSRCVCHNYSFEELKKLAGARTLSYEQLCDETGCGTGCGMCEPYIKLMLMTGETKFRVLNAASIKQQIQLHLAKLQSTQTPQIST